MGSSFKINVVLKVILVAMLVIAFRVWHLGVILRDEKLIEARKPRLREILIHPNRGTVVDRFSIPLTINNICYNATIYYGQIAQWPSRSWEENPSLGRTLRHPRKEYIRSLSEMLAPLLEMEADRIEDLIHAKASLFPHAPFVLKQGVSETVYARLRMLESQWVGLHAEIHGKRTYPMGKTGCHLVGTMGAIDRGQYTRAYHEMKALEDAIDTGTAGDIDVLQSRLKELKEKAYTMADWVGKSGIEKIYEDELRGAWGLKVFEVDPKGMALREVEGGRKAEPGTQVKLTISAELQAFAEELLIQSEQDREGRSFGIDPSDQTRKSLKQPWIKGGAIVALDPNTGEILAGASHPRFDPNDFSMSPNEEAVTLALEGEKAMSRLWDGLSTLRRERPKGEEELSLTWDLFLDTLLPQGGPLRPFFQKVDTIGAAVRAIEDFEEVRYFGKDAEAALPQKRLDTLFGPTSPKDRLFALDLLRLAVFPPYFSDALLNAVKDMKIETYRLLHQAFQQAEASLRAEAKAAYHAGPFAEWKREHQKTFIASKRKAEKQAKQYATPFIDYLDREERRQFKEYWESVKYDLILSCSLTLNDSLGNALSLLPDPLRIEFLRSFRSFASLDAPLYSEGRVKSEKELILSFWRKEGFGFLRSYAWQAAAPQGSIFKVAVAYEGLRQGHNFTLIDEGGETILARGANGSIYGRMYKGGRLPRTHAKNVGKIDIVGALEHSSNSYFALLAGDYLNDPADLYRMALDFGYGKKTGVDLPCESAGFFPIDIVHNRTALYSTTMGQHTMLATPLQTALMLASIANGGTLFQPQLKEGATQIKALLPMPDSVRHTLLEGMDRCVWSDKGGARPGVIRKFRLNCALKQEYMKLEHQFVGKTSTSEIGLNLNANPSSKPSIYKHVWFGAISFDPTKGPRWQHPELVVVVLLRYADAGREGAPIAAQMIQKWREIRNRHTVNATSK